MSTDSDRYSAHAGELLSGLVAVIRPKKVVTVGASDAGRTVLRALESAAPGVSPQLWHFVAGPTDSGIDDVVREHRPTFDVIETVTESLFDLPPRFLEDIGPFDLVWIDGESLVADARFVGALWPHIAPGGILAVQNSYLPAEANPLWNAILRFRADDVEALTLDAEGRPGIGLLRKQAGPLRDVDFTEEVIAATGVPVRIESIGIHGDAPLLDHATSVLHVLADPNLREILFAIGSGVSTVVALQSHTSLAGRALHKAIARLLTLSVVTRVDDRLVVDEKTFESFRDLPRTAPTPTQMSRYSRDRPDFLKAIAHQLSSTTWATEHHVNELCKLFDDDYATLRRELVDTGLLERDSAGSMYRSRNPVHPG